MLTGNYSYTKLVRAVSNAPYNVVNAISKIGSGSGSTTEYVAVSPVFELGYDTMLAVETDAQPLQVENPNIAFEEPQIIESSDVVTSTSVDETKMVEQTEVTEVYHDSPREESIIEVTSTPQAQVQVATVSTGSIVDDATAKEWIAQKESGGSYSVNNGIYIGRYQLSSAYLNGDHSPENQERVADAYVLQRYGSWSAAYQFWLANGWY
ncbi:peptidoglycan-binding protein LysM [Streptococcus suis]|uniref:aggregation-promoting factor C-terminal-like domain-containing protein n=1 Tax=Streptococcus suis TaxID=1307 RepID=UPI001EDD8231|nr:peptidoglycan-binding protein LysM [Streptococcus suis]